MSRMTPAERLGKVATSLQNKGVQVMLRRSKADVPHMTGKAGDTTFSVTYFGKTQTWCVFHPYPASQQTRFKCRDSAELAPYIQQLGDKT